MYFSSCSGTMKTTKFDKECEHRKRKRLLLCIRIPSRAVQPLERGSDHDYAIQGVFAYDEAPEAIAWDPGPAPVSEDEKAHGPADLLPVRDRRRAESAPHPDHRSGGGPSLHRTQCLLPYSGDQPHAAPCVLRRCVRVEACGQPRIRSYEYHAVDRDHRIAARRRYGVGAGFLQAV